MKALTICQPYAGLICDGRKRIENRKWYTRYRGELIIHAGKSKDWLDTWSPEFDGPWPKPMPLGAIVGRAQLVACYNDDLIRKPNTTLPANHSWVLSHKHAEGPFLWVLEDVQRLKEPIPWNGAQGLWDPSELIASEQWMFAEFEPVEPVLPKPFQIFGPERCSRRCSECPDGNHHWMEHFDDEHVAHLKHGLLIWYACKHCDAWSPDIEGEIILK